jgi:predicted aconitase
VIELSPKERALAAGELGPSRAAAMRILTEAADLMGADRLVQISSAHIDGCLYHGDGGVEFAEMLAEDGNKVSVPTTLNVGALDLLHPGLVRTDPHRYEMARRQMAAYVKLGCQPTWTCAPYQAGHRPKLGEQVAWGESNAVAFVNSVLGARTNRYGDFLDACCALTGRAPMVGLHEPAGRWATLLVDARQVSPQLKRTDAFYPVFGTWFGAAVGEQVAVIEGLPADITEDQLKALGAAASSSGAVALFHVAGVTPEAPDVEAAGGGRRPETTIQVTTEDLRDVRDRLSTTTADRLDAVAVGSPHFSLQEFADLESLLEGRRFSVPFYVCTGRGVLQVLESQGRLPTLVASGIEFIVDTCVVVTPILPEKGGVLMTNSGKFAHYTPANTGYEVVYGSLADCVASALTGTVTRDESLWT